MTLTSQAENPDSIDCLIAGMLNLKLLQLVPGTMPCGWLTSGIGLWVSFVAVPSSGFELWLSIVVVLRSGFLLWLSTVVVLSSGFLFWISTVVVLSSGFLLWFSTVAVPFPPTLVFAFQTQSAVQSIWSQISAKNLSFNKCWAKKTSNLSGAC